MIFAMKSVIEKLDAMIIDMDEHKYKAESEVYGGIIITRKCFN